VTGDSVKVTRLIHRGKQGFSADEDSMAIGGSVLPGLHDFSSSKERMLVVAKASTKRSSI
jgi:hypothetical protein